MILHRSLFEASGFQLARNEGFMNRILSAPTAGRSVASEYLVYSPVGLAESVFRLYHSGTINPGKIMASCIMHSQAGFAPACEGKGDGVVGVAQYLPETSAPGLTHTKLSLHSHHVWRVPALSRVTSHYRVELLSESTPDFVIYSPFSL